MPRRPPRSAARAAAARSRRRRDRAARAKRESAPFEFELPRSRRSSAAPPRAQEPVWEAEPEVVADDAPLAAAGRVRPCRWKTPPTRRRPTRPVSSRPTCSAARPACPIWSSRSSRRREPPARAGDFSFDDLDFEEPSGRRRLNQSQIFGESSVPSGDAACVRDRAAGRRAARARGAGRPALQPDDLPRSASSRDGGQADTRRRCPTCWPTRRSRGRVRVRR